MGSLYSEPPPPGRGRRRGRRSLLPPRSPPPPLGAPLRCGAPLLRGAAPTVSPSSGAAPSDAPSTALRVRLMRPWRSISDDFDHDLRRRACTSSSTRSTRCGASCEMWTRPSLPGKICDERAEVHDARDGAEIRLADLDVAREVFDHLLGLLAAVAVRRRDEHAAVVLDVDLDAGVGDDLVDDLAAWPDDVFDLVGADLRARSSAARTRESSRARSRDRLLELVDDEQAAFVGFVHRLAHDVDRDALRP